MAKHIFLVILLCAATLAFAQKTQVVSDPDAVVKDAELLIQLNNYLGARNLLDPYLAKKEVLNTKQHTIIRDEAKYYQALCAFELYQPDAGKLLTDFANSTHETAYKRLAYFHLGRYYFRDKKYKDAIDWFKKVDIDDLSADQLSEYNFQLAYCYFFDKQFKEALPLFKQSKEISNKYYYPSNYYYGYICFVNGDYDKALASFEKIKQSTIYQKIIPYYISQIYFKQKKFQQTVDYLQPIVDDGSQKYYLELNQLIGEAYFELGKYDDALPHLELYAGKGNSLRKEEVYQLGYCYYKTGRYDKAIERLQRLDNVDSLLGQNALFTLGDCYLKVNNKNDARTAFMKASRMSWDSTITENAGFQYGKLCYEAGMDNEAIRTFQNYITVFPKSAHTPECRELLTDLFLNSNNYKQALEIIEAITDKSPKIKKAYQLVAYSRGVQLYNQGKYQDALGMFDESLNNPVDPVIKGLCYYWKGESWFSLGEYQKANWQYPQFVTVASTTDIPNEEWYTITANYGNGYSYLKRKMYDEAITNFERAVTAGRKSNNDEIKNKILPDALLRLGDCYFMMKRYEKAVSDYGEVVDKNAIGKDYAMYQKGFILGLKGNNQQKISEMLQLVQLFPKGVYADDALFQAGSAYFEESDATSAISTFNRLIKEYPTSPYVTKSYLKIGLIYYNQDNWAKANESYNKILDNYPNTEDAKQAFGGKKDIAVASGNDSYIKDKQKITNTYLTASDAEKLSYDIAYNQFLNNNYEQAAAKYSDYLSTYGKGVYSLNAHFYRAESYFNTKVYDKALPDFKYVLDNKPNDFIEECARSASYIAYEKDKDYQAANNYFQLLLANATKKENIFVANLGLMRTYYLLDKVGDAANYANVILASDQSSTNNVLEANFYLGKQAFNKKDYAKAGEYFKKPADGPLNNLAAEAKYRLALLENLKGNYEQSNKMAYETANKISDYVDWTARTYILLGDNYAALGNYFQSKATLQSVLDNYEGNDKTIKEEAQNLLEKVTKAEESKSKFKIDNDTSGSLQEDPNLKLDLTVPGNNQKP